MPTAPRTTAPTPAPEAKKYLNSEEAARILRLSARTLERMRVEGSGPRARVLYRPADIEAWLDAQTYQSTSEYGR